MKYYIIKFEFSIVIDRPIFSSPLYGAKLDPIIGLNSASRTYTVVALFSGASVNAGCYIHLDYGGVYFWTAGQRIDPSTKSTFVWRVVTEDFNLVTPITYTNWEPSHGQPDYHEQNEACMHIMSNKDYKWNDEKCQTFLGCSVCEIAARNAPEPGEILLYLTVWTIMFRFLFIRLFGLETCASCIVACEIVFVTTQPLAAIQINHLSIIGRQKPPEPEEKVK